MSAVVIPFPSRQQTIAAVAPDTPARLDADQRHALLYVECPYCIAPAGEDCQTESGRPLREPHMRRVYAWADMDLTERGTLAARADLRAAQQEEESHESLA